MINEEAKLRSIKKVITKEMVLNYANVSGDHNPIHIDENYAKNTDFGGTIVHGMFLISSIFILIYLLCSWMFKKV